MWRGSDACSTAIDLLTASGALMPDRPAASTSPFLRQHAENPVDWREWGEEAFAEARERDVPILLSCGQDGHAVHIVWRQVDRG